MAFKHGLYRFGVHAALRALTARGSYQPVLHRARQISGGQRGTHERLDALLPVLEEVQADSVIDLGCAEGYMVRRIAESGRFVLGVDENVRALSTAHLSLSSANVQGWGLIRLTLNAETVELLPPMDATISLSVMHHVMIHQGVDHAERMMKAIRERTRKVVIFEMGQSDETAFAWSSRLPDMGSDPHAWIASWVESCGFADVRAICKVPSFNSDIERATFAAYTKEQ